jgi:hypothetical protein
MLLMLISNLLSSYSSNFTSVPNSLSALAMAFAPSTEYNILYEQLTSIHNLNNTYHYEP